MFNTKRNQLLYINSLCAKIDLQNNEDINYNIRELLYNIEEELKEEERELQTKQNKINEAKELLQYIRKENNLKDTLY